MLKHKIYSRFNNYKQTIILIPGWGTDYRIFSNLQLPYNVIYIDHLLPSPESLEKDILSIIIDKKISKPLILGLSLGGFLAAQFAANNPDLFSHVILLSIKKHYSKTELDQVRNSLLRSKPAFLNAFYKNCFYLQKNYIQFKKNLLTSYLNKFDLNYLLEMLDILQKQKLDTNLVNSVKNITILQGEKDHIAPFAEVKKFIPKSILKPIPDAGHLFVYTWSELKFS
jgi:pimeloyl-ACP methyl ester carboxylesterase